MFINYYPDMILILFCNQAVLFSTKQLVPKLFREEKCILMLLYIHVYILVKTRDLKIVYLLKTSFLNNLSVQLFDHSS